MSSALRPADAAPITTQVPPVAGRAGLRADWAAATLVVLFFALLVFPIAASTFRWHLVGSFQEKRMLAKAPGWPHSWHDLLALPGRLSALADDRFGYRNELVWLDGWLHYRLFGEVDSDQVVFGRHGRLFLTRHNGAQPFSTIDVVCGVGFDSAKIHALAASVVDLLRGASGLAARNAFVIIPSAPVLYPQELPPWLAARCRRGRPVVPAVRDALAAGWPDMAWRLVYPLAAMRQAEAGGPPAIPLGNFHWAAAAAKAVVEEVAEHTLHLTKQREIGVRRVIGESDLANLIPGITLRNPTTVADFTHSGVRQCRGVSCFPELKPFAPVLLEVSHFWWESGSGPTLVLLSNSFGARAAEFFGEYFANVIHLNADFQRMSAEQRQRLPVLLRERFKPDVLLFLDHDEILH